MTKTLAERNEYRARNVARFGLDPTIPEATADEIRQRVSAGYVILAEEYTGPRLSLSVNPRTDVSSRARYDLDTDLMKTYGSRPYRYSTDFTSYRLTFTTT